MPALVRPPSDAYASCIRSDPSISINVDRARKQHRAYCDTLRACGLEVRALPAEPDLPDACFVEDTAVIVAKQTILTRPGAEARRGELPSIAEAISPAHRITKGHLDGGDVIVAGKVVFVGLSSRTDEEGAAELARIVKPLGVEVRTVPIGKSLHLKSKSRNRRARACWSWKITRSSAQPRPARLRCWRSAA